MAEANGGYPGWDRIACPVCGGADFAALFEKGGEPFVRCRGCGLTLINPRRPFAEIRAGYDAAYSAGYTRKAAKKRGGIAEAAKKLIGRKK